jgi:hypothetical protein
MSAFHFPFLSMGDGVGEADDVVVVEEELDVVVAEVELGLLYDEDAESVQVALLPPPDIDDGKVMVTGK